MSLIEWWGLGLISIYLAGEDKLTKNMTVQVKNGNELFWREKKRYWTDCVFSSHILRKMQKQKKSQESCMETMGAAGHGLYRHLCWAAQAHSN